MINILLTLNIKKMENKPIEVTVTWNPNYDEGSLNDRIENAIIKKVSDLYIETIDKKFKSKVDELVTSAVSLMIKDIKTIPLDTCDLEKGQIKKSMNLRDYIVQRAVDSLKVKCDSYGRTDSGASSDKKTPIEWQISKTINQSAFTKELQIEIQRVQNEYQTNLRTMITSALAPIYEQLLLKLKS
jgi:hypothetical protein